MVDILTVHLGAICLARTRVTTTVVVYVWPCSNRRCDCNSLCCSTAIAIRAGMASGCRMGESQYCARQDAFNCHHFVGTYHWGCFEGDCNSKTVWYLVLWNTNSIFNKHKYTFIQFNLFHFYSPLLLFHWNWELPTKNNGSSRGMHAHTHSNKQHASTSCMSRRTKWRQKMRNVTAFQI